jgi:AraC family transcriptional regulator
MFTQKLISKEGTVRTTTAVFIAAILLVPAINAAEDIEVITVQPFGYCCIHKTAPFTEIEKAINELWQNMQAQQIMPTGAMFGVYYNAPDQVSPEKLDWEIGFPVSNVNPQAPLQAKVWEHSQVAKTVHVGPYENTGETYEKVFAWMTQNGYEQTGPVMERYLTMPGPDVDPQGLRAEIWIPVKKK